jgi:hypothetical protein
MPPGSIILSANEHSHNLTDALGLPLFQGKARLSNEWQERNTDL